MTPVYSKDVYELLDALNGSDTSIGDRRMSDSLRNCLSRGMIRISDYMEWGYSEMYIATLNYSYGHGWVLLHTLTLMKVLDHKTTEKGNQYKLLVNPDENPEYFDIAA